METGKLHDKFERCFLDWITQQHQDLEELLHALAWNPDDENLRVIVAKDIKHFEEYNDNRALLAKHDVLCPSWCSCFENAFLWIGGCRPSLSIRLVYCLCGSQLDTAQLMKSSSPAKSRGNLGEISSNQLNLINSLHMKTIEEEERVSDRISSIQAK